MITRGGGGCAAPAALAETPAQVVPGKFVAMKGPKTLGPGVEWRDGADGYREFSPAYYVDILHEFGVQVAPGPARPAGRRRRPRSAGRRLGLRDPLGGTWPMRQKSGRKLGKSGQKAAESGGRAAAARHRAAVKRRRRAASPPIPPPCEKGGGCLMQGRSVEG